MRIDHAMRARFSALWARAWAPVDGASLAAFRFFVGALLTVSAIRFLAFGWIDRMFVEPRYFFPYWGFEWVRPLPSPFMHAVFVVLAIAGVMIALGAFYRIAAPVALVLFAYIQLCDLTNYLNHYYLVTLQLFLLSVLPLHRSLSFDARRRPAIARAWQPAWMLWLVRFQIGVVYFFAGLAKASGDWLLHAQPLRIWLQARTDLPLLGPLFQYVEVAYLMSWAGFLYDLTIPLWLSWRRTRLTAYVVLIVFHTITPILFPIGMFPAIMTTSALVFFEPDWPRRLLGRWRGGRRDDVLPFPGIALPPATPLRAVGTAALLAWCAFQIAFPLRFLLYGGNVLWHEQGFRFSWRVMCREVNGSVVYRVRAAGWSRERFIAPGRYLSEEQEREFGASPDMILKLAHHIAAELEAQGHRDVQVRADAFASLNGRPMARLVDPDVDLAQIEDSILPANWILPAPTDPPAQGSEPLWALLRGAR